MQENNSDAVVDDEVDFPLSPNGDLDFHRVKLWWGIRTCLVRFFMFQLPRVFPFMIFGYYSQPLEPFSWKVFQPRDRKTISNVAVHNLTYGRQNNMFLICKSTQIRTLFH